MIALMLITGVVGGILVHKATRDPAVSARGATSRGTDSRRLDIRGYGRR